MDEYKTEMIEVELMDVTRLLLFTIVTRKYKTELIDTEWIVTEQTQILC